MHWFHGIKTQEEDAKGPVQDQGPGRLGRLGPQSTTCVMFYFDLKFHRDMFIQAKVIQFFKTDKLSFSILMCKDHGIWIENFAFLLN